MTKDLTTILQEEEEKRNAIYQSIQDYGAFLTSHATSSEFLAYSRVFYKYLEKGIDKAQQKLKNKYK